MKYKNPDCELDEMDEEIEKLVKKGVKFVDLIEEDDEVMFNHVKCSYEIDEFAAFMIAKYIEMQERSCNGN